MQSSRFFSFVLLALLCAGSVQGQQGRGSIQGTVTDATGAASPAAAGGQAPRARPDALSYLVPFAAQTGRPPPSWISFALVLPTLLLCLWCCPRTASGFASGFALTFLVFFAFNKQAFCNYYHLVLAGLCCALASLDTPLPSTNRPQPC